MTSCSYYSHQIRHQATVGWLSAWWLQTSCSYYSHQIRHQATVGWLSAWWLQTSCSYYSHQIRHQATVGWLSAWWLQTSCSYYLHQIRHQATVGWLSAWWLQMANAVILRHLCGCVWVNTITPEGWSDQKWIDFRTVLTQCILCLLFCNTTNRLTLTVLVTTIDALQHFETG